MVEDLKNAYESATRLRHEMERWLDQSRQMDPPSRHGGGEDEAYGGSLGVSISVAGKYFMFVPG